MWIEVNIQCRPEDRDVALTKLVRNIVNECESKTESWHFLWEGKPWPTTLRLRFFGEDEKINEIRLILDEKLISIPHCYGAHGDCGEDIQYIGEADSWGIEAWEKGMKFMELGSEFALDLIENEEKLKYASETYEGLKEIEEFTEFMKGTGQ